MKPYDIYEVNLTKIEKTELKGSKDPNATYPVVALEFTGCGDSKGIFSQNIFIPTTEDDMKRPVFQNKEGHDYERPSRFENFQFTLMQIVHAINPAGEEKIKEKRKTEETTEIRIASPYTDSDRKYKTKSYILLYILVIALVALAIFWSVKQITIDNRVTSVMKYVR